MKTMEIGSKKFTTVSDPPKIGSYKSYKIDIPTTCCQKRHHIIQTRYLEIVIHGVRIQE